MKISYFFPEAFHNLSSEKNEIVLGLCVWLLNHLDTWNNKTVKGKTDLFPFTRENFIRQSFPWLPRIQPVFFPLSSLHIPPLIGSTSPSFLSLISSSVHSRDGCHSQVSFKHYSVHSTHKNMPSSKRKLKSRYSTVIYVEFVTVFLSCLSVSLF